MVMEILYQRFPDFLKKHFSTKVQKISLNAGFSCPNRDGSIGTGGCVYCNNLTFSPSYSMPDKSITQQLEEGVQFFGKKYPEMDYLAYFQSYTNTYGNLQSLKEKYEEALRFPKVKGLVIATRPDCISTELADYFAELSQQHFLLVELGVESTNNDTLKRIHRGHDYETAVNCIQGLAQRGIMTGVHLILGLPGESREDMLLHADKISQLPITTLKLHQLQLIRGTILAEQVAAHPDEVHLFSAEEYAALVVDFMERLRPDIVMDRFVSQSPTEWLIAPDWGLKNFEFTHLVDKRMQDGHHYQGKLYSDKCACNNCSV